MTSILSWPFLASLLAGIGSVGLVRQLWRVRDRPGARWFLVTLAGQSVFCLAYAGALLVSDVALRYALEVLAIVALNWVGVSFLAFALEYTGRSSLVSSWYVRAQFVFPVLTTALLPLNRVHGLFWTDFTVERAFGAAGATYTTQPLLFVTVLGGTVGAGVGMLLLVETFLDYGPLYRTEAIAVALSPLPPSVGILAWLFGFGPVPEINMTAVLFVPHVLLDGYALVWSDMFEFHPATKRAAERSALDDLGSPVVVVDSDGRVVDLNRAASALFPDAGTVVTKPVGELLGTPVSFAEDQRLSLQQNGRRRAFRLRPAPLTDSGDNHVGYTLLFEDLTEEVRREQRLEVLNRVLRHNLRNDMSVVKGNIAMAQERTEEETVSAALDSADAKADELVSTSEKARNVAETVQEASDGTAPLDVTARCRAIVDQSRARNPSATLTVTGEPEAIVETRPSVFEAVIENLVENAVQHSGENPTVSVTVERRADDLVCVEVSDDGPGVPRSELETLRSGEETDLQHGSGFGLWVVKWGAELLGRDVSFEVDGDGTSATVCIPDQAESSQTRSPSA